jgi:TPR repeat protein
MYGKGQGELQDNKETLKWFLLAAEQGKAFAQYNLGLMYDNGQGVPQDDAKAHMWFNLGASQGHKLAQKNRDLVADMMTPAQISEAQTMAREWIAAHPDL